MEEKEEKIAGNAAAMREALVALRDAARNFCHQILNSKYNDIMDEYKCRERGFPALLDLRYAIPKANAAISAPARNCDRFRRADEADKAFNEFCAAERTGKCKPAECSLPSGTGAKSCQLAWLFATAAEGGAK